MATPSQQQLLAAYSLVYGTLGQIGTPQGLSDAQARTLVAKMAQRLADGISFAQVETEAKAAVANPQALPGGQPGGKPGATPQPATPQPHEVTGSIVDAVMQARPNPSDPKYQDPQSGSFLYTQDMQGWLKAVTEATTTQATIDQARLGIVKLPNGQLLFPADVSKLNQQEQQQVKALAQNQQIDAQNAYGALLNKYGLDQYNTAASATNTANTDATRDFQNKQTQYEDAVGLGKMSLEQAVDAIDRQLKGMGESRARATEVDTSQRANLPWETTPGKSSFSADDIGGIAQLFAQRAGLPGGAPLLNFTGTRTFDPQATMNAGDQALGVGGPLPQVPQPVQGGVTLNTNQIPAAPGYRPPPPVPTFQRPQAPVPMPVPQLAFAGPSVTNGWGGMDANPYQPT